MIPLVKNGDSAEQGGPADPRRRLHRGRAAEVREGRAPAVDILFATSPFKERRPDFNVWGLCPPAAESGISRPSTGVHRRSPAGSQYDAFGSERYVLTFDNRAFRDVASFAPYEFVEILVNGQTYGGGGIFNLYATVAADSAWAPYVFVHEFGHHFAGLADEYYTSDVAYLPAADPRRAVGAERHGAARSGDAEVEGPRARRARRCRRRGTRRRSRRTRARSRRGGAPSARRTSRRPRWTRCSASSRPKRSACSVRNDTHTAVGAFEGAHVRGARLLPAAGGLHHVHAQPGAVLRGVPAGALEGDRSLRGWTRRFVDCRLQAPGSRPCLAL